MKKWIFALISLPMILGACSGDFTATGEPLPYDPNEREPLELGGGDSDNTDDSSDEAEVVEIPEGLTDGVYETSGEGFGGDITVKTTIEGGKIVSIEVLSHSETDGISDPAISGIPTAIVDEYSLGVDNVSGATWSSKGIKAAVQAAIDEASGGGSGDSGDSEEVVEIPETLTDGVYETAGEGFGGDVNVTTTIEGGKIVSIEVGDHGETPGISDPAISDIPSAIIDQYSLGVDNVTGASWTSKGIKEAVSKAIEEANAGGSDEATSGGAEIPEGLTDGVYETSGEGFGGDVNVTTTIEGGKIVSIEVGDHGETPGISDPAISDIPSAIIDQYSLEVDNVSGATWTSKGIKEAVTNAVNEASN